MFYIYLASLIFGGGLLSFSLMFGDGSHDSDAHIDHHHETTDAVKLFSSRNIIFFLTFFGMTGSLFHFIDMNAIFTLAMSFVMGGMAAMLGYKVMKYLKGSESGEAIDVRNLNGKIAYTIMPISKDHKGKIAVEVANQTLELVAMISPVSNKESFAKGEKVLISEFAGTHHLVISIEEVF